MAKHTLELDDLELTALITHLEGESEMMVESRLNCSNPRELPDREEVLLNLVYSKAFTIGYEADKNPKVDFNLIQNQDRIYKYKWQHYQHTLTGQKKYWMSI